ncbi:long-chain acyl-CoA synthetase [Paraburkholderia unamae]|uniref:class I adenylate-forming enzyme family protein n=1 Tax=Paraburkholderia unamae TaxID=219649 RepID=UPI000DC21A5B|nr:AMP-binding protein [Paraburkholderia unamae]RAR57157.1 long-chain acyl-CoA synthetase [Paraburkholderia unamae]
MQEVKPVMDRIDAIVARRMQRGREILTELEAASGRTYAAMLRERAQRRLARPAVVYRGRTLTYAQLLDAVDIARQTLRECGVREQQVVALLMNNSDHYLVWYLAVLGIGAVAVPLNNRLVAGELAFILEHSQSMLTISEPAFSTVLAQVRDAYGLAIQDLVVDIEASVAVAGSPQYRQEPDLDANAAAAIYYTSGTTGKPKGVVHTHASLFADALQSPAAWEYDHDDARLLAVTPLFHIAAHTCFFPVLFTGGTLHIDQYSTERTIELVRRERVTAMFAVPSILMLMVEKARTLGVVLDSVKTLDFGAAPMTIARLGEVQALFPNASLVHGMGQTESGGTLVTLPGELAVERAGSVGLPMAGVEVAIFDHDDRELPRGQVGELVARGPNLMRGYLRDEAATAATLRNGWLHTGDLGYQSGEGLVTLVDRKKDMIIRGGENIYSSEVEQVLLKHPLVKAAAVVGQPDTLFGEQVCAFLATDPEQPPPSVEALLSHCRCSLADYKVPVTFRFVEQMPLTSTGKIMKAELRAMLTATEQNHA